MCAHMRKLIRRTMCVNVISVIGRNIMRTVLGVICLVIGVAAMIFTFLYTDHAVEFFRLSGEHAQMGVRWLGVWIWLPFTIVGVVLFAK